MQNEKKVVPTDVKVDFINRLTETGLKAIEATSFVSAKWVPQMGDNSEVMARIYRSPGCSYPVLTPNMKGYEAALEAGAKEVAIFAAASDTFSMKNINCNVLDSFERFRPVCEAAIAAGVRVRGYVRPAPWSACRLRLFSCAAPCCLCAVMCRACWAARTRAPSRPTLSALSRNR